MISQWSYKFNYNKNKFKNLAHVVVVIEEKYVREYPFSSTKAIGIGTVMTQSARGRAPMRQNGT